MSPGKVRHDRRMAERTKEDDTLLADRGRNGSRPKRQQAGFKIRADFQSI